jgi:hypothetical protein
MVLVLVRLSIKGVAILGTVISEFVLQLVSVSSNQHNSLKQTLLAG